MNLSAPAAHLATAAPVVAGVRRTVLAVLAVMLFAVVALPATALALQTRPETSAFNGADADTGAFTGLARVAAHQASGTVYAIDANAGAVDKFDATGAAQDFSALASSSLDGNAVTAPDGPVSFSLGADADLAVDNSGTASDGHLVVLAENQQTAWVFDATGTYLHQITGFSDPCGAAVDTAGNIWISDYAAQAVIQYTPGGVATGTTIDTSGEGNPCHIAFDSADNLYVARYNSEVLKYDSSGVYQGQIDSAPTKAVAVDRATGQVYVAHLDKVSVYDDAGAHLYDFADGISDALTGVAINQAANQIYVADSPGNAVHVFGPAIPAPPVVSATSAADIASAEATMKAKVNPRGETTTYHFEYGPTLSYGSSMPVPDASVGSGVAAFSVSQALTGLQPATTYHFRIVATNINGATNGPDRTFTTYEIPVPQSCSNDRFRAGHGATLPDCRAYEQVTPTGKNGNNPIGGVDYVEAADNGDAITFPVPGGMPGGVGSQQYPLYLARRDAGAWSTAGLLPSVTHGQNAAVKGWTRDMATVFDTATLFEQGTSTFLARDSADGSIATIVPHTLQLSDGVGLLDTVSYAGSSRDGAKVYFEAVGAITPDAVSGVSNLYVWDRASDTVSLASVLPDGTTPSDGSFAGPYNIGQGDLSGGGAQASSYTQDNGAVSDDGSTVFFTAAGTAQLYARREATTTGASTVQVSASQKTNGAGPGGSDPNGPQPAAFMAATHDASKVLFTSPEALTNDANTGPGDEGNDLYVYDLATNELTDLTHDAGDANGADVQGVIGISDDGSYVYFAANGELADGVTPGDCNGSNPNSFSGVCNLYVWHDGDTAFISRLTQGGSDGTVSDATNWSTTSVPGGEAAESTGRVTPDGRTVLFTSKRRLTAYDNSSGCRSNPAGGGAPIYPCVELYRYRVGEAGVTCVSCNPSGVVPTSRATVQTLLAPFGGKPAATRTRNLSASGDRVFFESRDPLLPGDTNGVQDVYVWQADGSGSCGSSTGNVGCLFLLSTGRSQDPSYFADASVSGDDAFFYTSERLVGQDQGGLVDIYDAHVGGGLPAQYPAPEMPCSGEACRAPMTVPTMPTIAGSVSFSGEGNLGGARTRTSVSVSKLRAVTGSVGKLRVKVPRPGRISVSGTSLTTTTRSVSRGATYRVTVRLSRKAQRALKRNRTLKVKAKVTFTPKSGISVTKTMTLVFKQVKRAKKSTTGRRAGSRGGH